MLSEAGLDNFYRVREDQVGEGAYGAAASNKPIGDLSYLDQEQTQNELLLLKTPSRASVAFTIPAIHCSACIYLLENLPELLDGIIEARVDFLNKRCTLLYDPRVVKLSEIAVLLTKIGYEPVISLGGSVADKKNKSRKNRELKKLYLKIGVAFFCFGNIMMLALPEYLSGGNSQDDTFIKTISTIQLFLGIPLLYSLSGYLKSAWGSLKVGKVNLDVPISIGVVALFLRSNYEIISGTGPGYFDSLAGLAFFLLLGRLFQEKTYQGLSFSRDYTAFFPLSVTLIEKDIEKSVLVKNIKKGDTLFFRNNEIIPIEAIIIDGSLKIDYSFVTGESDHIHVGTGETLYPGGKVIGHGGKVVASKNFDQGYLNSLWMKEDQAEDLKEGTGISAVSDRVAQMFTGIVLAISALSFVYWQLVEGNRSFEVLAAVLIVACPCALALTTPFTYGTVMRLLGMRGLYLKNDSSVEKLADIDTIVFDKTGTLTHNLKNNKGTIDIDYNEVPDPISEIMLINAILTLSKNSSHPLSREIYENLSEAYEDHQSEIKLDNYEEIPGKGIRGLIAISDSEDPKFDLAIGSREWLSPTNTEIPSNFKSAKVYISLNSQIIGGYSSINNWRAGISDIVNQLKRLSLKTYILSGDNDRDQQALNMFGFEEEKMRFGMRPDDKKRFIGELEEEGHLVLMAGDGLNDIGALSASHLGVAVTDNTNNFTPKSDGIILGKELALTPKALLLARKARKTVYISLVVSLLYNIAGLFFAISGQLTPVFAAILMPVSSITVVSLTVGKSYLDFRTVMQKISPAK